MCQPNNGYICEDTLLAFTQLAADIRETSWPPLSQLCRPQRRGATMIVKRIVLVRSLFQLPISSDPVWQISIVPSLALAFAPFQYAVLSLTASPSSQALVGQGNNFLWVSRKSHRPFQHTPSQSSSTISPNNTRSYRPNVIPCLMSYFPPPLAAQYNISTRSDMLKDGKVGALGLRNFSVFLASLRKATLSGS